MQLLSLVILSLVVSSAAMASSKPKILRQAKATVFTQKHWYAKENNEIVLKVDKVCEKEILIDVIEYKLDPDFNYVPKSITCDTDVNGKHLLLTMIPQIMESVVESQELPLLPPGKRIKLISGFFQVFSGATDGPKIQPVLGDYFMTEDLDLKTAYLNLMPTFSHSTQTNCDDKGNCKIIDSTDAPDVVFSTVFKIEDNL